MNDSSFTTKRFSLVPLKAIDEKSELVEAALKAYAHFGSIITVMTQYKFGN